MRLEMTGQMRMEQRMKLAPHLIQSMEILQLPAMALQERIEQEVNSNIVLELVEPQPDPDVDGPIGPTDRDEDQIEYQSLIVDTDPNKLHDFQRLASFGQDVGEYLELSGPVRVSADQEEDPKLQAIKNAPAPPRSLHDYLVEQWQLVDAPEPVKKAGRAIIDFIDRRGYLTVQIEQLHNKDQDEFTLQDLKEALRLVQTLDPPGVGARDLRECLLIQMAQSDEDMSFEMELVDKYFQDLLENRLPEIAKKAGCSIERVRQAIARLRRFDTSPGLQIGQDHNLPITPDVIVQPTADGKDYTVTLVDEYLPNLRLNQTYLQMAKDPNVSKPTRQFLQNNIRSAQWILEAIRQRNDTLLKVTKAIVRFQKDFLDKGPLYLKPLPMSKIAQEVGVHVATVSRAVAGKYMQCPWGLVPLRRFFCGGLEDQQGQQHSWEAIRAQLQRIIDSEDKANPLSDDQIRQRLAEAGFPNIARRTVAKYRSFLNIPPARLRRRY
ncbi:MAG: RNA polymerase factor sigma-54 [Sedimentisphaerales bacterium]|nr:RNA polymerase factor sigma-54 [Sedimentisphaerales bacterium]